MAKDTLVLADSTVIELESSQGIGALHVTAEDIPAAAELWEKFTSDNLSAVSILNSAGLTAGVYEDMVLDHVVGTENADGTIDMLFSLREKTETEVLAEKLAALEETTDEAIADLGETVSDLASNEDEEGEAE